jgi:hypothetical protein
MELLKNLEGMSADEQMTAVVELQKAAMKQLEEQKQVSIGKSAEMVIQGLKKIKSDFEAKFDSLNYDIQAKVASLKDGEQGIQGPKGDQGDRGLDGANGRDGRDGKDGRDGLDGVDGVGVRDAKIDFDGSLVISLTDGREINCGEVVSVDVAKQIQKVTHNIQTGSGGDSQTVLDAIAALQATIATYGTMATQNKTSVDIEGGTIDNTVIGGTTPAAGTFTTLTATGQTSLGGASGSESLRVLTPVSAAGLRLQVGVPSSTVVRFGPAGSAIADFRILAPTFTNFYTGSSADGLSDGNAQMRVSHTASAVNYVQVTGAATGGRPLVSVQGSDTNINIGLLAKGSGVVYLQSGSGAALEASATGNANYFSMVGTAAGTDPVLTVKGSDTNIDLVLSPKGTGALQAQQTDSTATGGNARGANAVDWQTSRNNPAQVASANNTFIGSGFANSASGGYAVATGGFGNNSGGVASFTGSGSGNGTTATYGAIVCGANNTSSGAYSFIGAGASNNSAGYYNFIGGGFTNSGTSSSAVTTQSATMNGTTAVTLSASNASIKVGQIISGTSISGNDTYVAAISGTSLTLSKNASGSSTSTLSFYTPHGVVVGGGNNQPTGSYSFIGGGGDAGTAGNRNVASGDWSVVGGGFKNTASNTYSFVGGGENNAASAARSIVVGGQGNTASSTHAFVGGGAFQTGSGTYSCIVGGYQHISSGDSSAVMGGVLGTTRSITGNHVFPACNNPIGSGANGTNQTALLILGRQTTDATATVLTSNLAAATTTNQVILPNNSAYTFRGEIVSGVTGGGNSKSWTIEGLIKRGANAASTTLVGSTVTSSYADAGASTWTIALTADTTNGGLAVTFTGQASTTIRTVCRINTVEMTY